MLPVFFYFLGLSYLKTQLKSDNFYNFVTQQILYTGKDMLKLIFVLLKNLSIA